MTSTIEPQFVLPLQYSITQEGVTHITASGTERVLSIPLWCSQTFDVAARFEWITTYGQRRMSIMLLDTLISPKEVSKWLVRRGVTGFACTDRGKAAVHRYMHACVQLSNKDFSVDKVDIKKSAARAISTLAASFIGRYSKQITELLLTERYWTIPDGERYLCVGRTQRESETDFSHAPGWSLAVLPYEFTEYARTLGYERRELNRLLRLGKVRQRQLILSRDAGISPHVWVLPLRDSDYAQRGSSVRCRYQTTFKV